MKQIITILAAALTIVATMSCNKDITEVWAESSGRVPPSWPTPPGFTISPSEAQTIADKYFGPRKNVWHIYADSTNYYIVDGFFGSSPSRAAKAGLKINGTSGEFIDLRTGETKPNPLKDQEPKEK